MLGIGKGGSETLDGISDVVPPVVPRSKLKDRSRLNRSLLCSPPEFSLCKVGSIGSGDLVVGWGCCRGGTGGWLASGSSKSTCSVPHPPNLAKQSRNTMKSFEGALRGRSKQRRWFLFSSYSSAPAVNRGHVPFPRSLVVPGELSTVNDRGSLSYSAEDLIPQETPTIEIRVVSRWLPLARVNPMVEVSVDLMYMSTLTLIATGPAPSFELSLGTKNRVNVPYGVAGVTDPTGFHRSPPLCYCGISMRFLHHGRSSRLMECDREVVRK